MSRQTTQGAVLRADTAAATHLVHKATSSSLFGPAGPFSLTIPFERLAASRALVWTAFAVCYLAAGVYLARLKLLWDDEFFTLFLSSTSSWRELLHALATGADQHPPSFYYLTHGLMHLFGTGHVVLRLPALFGFALLCVCLYEIVRSLTTALWGVVAMLFPLASHLFYYATEARAYGLEAGLLALAVLAWMRATEFRHRSFYLPVLAFSVAGAVGCHYYAAFAVLCLGAGELARTYGRRRVDLLVWAALGASCLPIVLFWGVIKQARNYSGHFWAVPVWSDSLDFFRAEFGTVTVAIVGVLSFLLCFERKVLTPRRTLSIPATLPSLNFPRATALYSLAALPFFVMVAAKYITHGFSNRYVIPSLIGVTVVLCCVLHRLFPHTRATLAVLLTCFCVFIYQFHELQAKELEQRAAYADERQILAATGNDPLVLSDLTTFLRFSFYAPRDFVNRLSFLPDPKASVSYLGQDTLDRGEIDLRPWFPVNIQPVPKYLASHPDFLVFGGVSHWSWLSYQLPRYGDVRLLSRTRNNALLLGVHTDPSKLPSPTTSFSFSTDLPPLYDRMPRQGPSLCVLYMGIRSCGADLQ